MVSNFVFEAPSDEEYDPEPHDDQKTVAAWDFAAYSEAAAEEHSRRNTTSVDYKIQKLRQKTAVPLTNPIDSDSESEVSDPEPTQVCIFLIVFNFNSIKIKFNFYIFLAFRVFF